MDRSANVAVQVGKCPTVRDCSFEHNQSYPTTQKSTTRTSFGLDENAEKYPGDECSSYSKRISDRFLNKMSGVMNLSIGSSSGARDNVNVSHSKENNKSIFTVTVHEWEVLTTNKLALELLGYSASEVVGKDLRTFWIAEESSCSEMDSINSLSSDNIAIESNPGKTVDFKHKKGFSISTLMRQKVVEEPSGTKCRIVIVEPVERMSCFFDFNEQGEILYCDENFVSYHGLQIADLQSLSIQKLMPAYILPPPQGSSIPKDVRLQCTASTFANGSRFPVTVFIASQHVSKKMAGEPRRTLYQAKLWVFPHLSGVVTCKSNGEIQNVNDNLSKHLFGYSSKELRALSLFDLIPDLVQNNSTTALYGSIVPHIEMDSSLEFSSQGYDNSKNEVHDVSTAESWVELSVASNEENDNPDTPRSTDQNHSDFLNKINALLNNSTGSPVEEASHQPTVSSHYKESSSDSAIHSHASSSSSTNKYNKPNNQSSFSDYHSADASENANQVTEYRMNAESHDESSYVVVHNDTYENVSSNDTTRQNVTIPVNTVNRTPAFNRLTRISEAASTSTPLEQGRSSSRISDHENVTNNLQNGFFRSKFKHKHGALMDFCYELNKVNIAGTPDQMLYFRVFAQTLPTPKYSFDGFNSTLMSTASTLPSLNASTKSSLHGTGSLDGSQNEIEAFEDHIEKQAIEGEFSTRYTLVKQIGRGAFGFVQTATCQRTSEEFVVKFIQKERILDECWVYDDEIESMIPLEIDFLVRFDHPNIIKVVDYFENKSFFSMVMPKHGMNGMDLFEFIDRTNNGDDRTIGEPLSSYMFRQIVSAVSYLHARSILHRDVKDENVIIDERFRCKLIDFGSATFFKPGQVFSTFCGTLEYCSPEVLLGNKYRGPELEMWSLGVTLYTIVFGENPFRDVDETIACEIKPPFAVTKGLAAVLQGLLHPHPEWRSTVKDLLESKWINQVVYVEDYHWDDMIINTKESFHTSSVHENHPEFDEENLHNEFSELSIANNKQGGGKRYALRPVTNLNNTI